MSCPLHTLTHVHTRCARTHTHTQRELRRPWRLKVHRRGLHPLCCNKVWTWTDLTGLGESPAHGSNGHSMRAGPAWGNGEAREGYVQDPPIRSRSPAPAARWASLYRPVLCWHAPAPNPTTPSSVRGLTRGSAAAPNRARWGCSPPLTPRVQGLLAQGPGTCYFHPWDTACAALLCPAGLWADGRPAGPWPAPASFLRAQHPSKSSDASSHLRLPRRPAWHPLSALHTPGGSGWAAPGVGRHSACHPRNFRLPFPGQHIASVWGSCGC